MPPSLSSLYIHVRSLECQPCHRFAFRNCLPPPSLLPGVHREDFVTAGGQVVAPENGGGGDDDAQYATTTNAAADQREREIHTKVDDFDRTDSDSSLCLCVQGALTCFSPEIRIIWCPTVWQICPHSVADVLLSRIILYFSGSERRD